MPKKQIDLEEAIALKKDDPSRRYEYPDPTPMAPPIGYKRQPSLHDQIRSMIRTEKVRQALEAAGLETAEEADDFEVGDDYDPASPHEHNFDPPLHPAVQPSASPLKSAPTQQGTSPSAQAAPPQPAAEPSSYPAAPPPPAKP